MSEKMGAWSSLLDMLVPIHRDGHKFVAISAALTLVLFLVWPVLSILALAVTLWLAFFFRDPDRFVPIRSGLVLAPADGRIIAVDDVVPSRELGFGDERKLRISIHLSLLDVHVNRSPITGRVTRSIYVPGAFFNPTLDKASIDNERRALIVADEKGREIAVVQIAGVISRRIVTFAGEGDTLTAGQRFGLIRLGSRVDVYLPGEHSALVAVGQRAIAGETVLADLASDEAQRQVRRS